ncbi:MAG: hypothetical protein RLZZ520_1131 [Bacteroidota bacterium]|jgi:hypothetical protein
MVEKTKGPAKADPSVLTNPLNSPTKLQIDPTFQNYFLELLITFEVLFNKGKIGGRPPL